MGNGVPKALPWAEGRNPFGIQLARTFPPPEGRHSCRPSPTCGDKNVAAPRAGFGSRGRSPHRLEAQFKNHAATIVAGHPNFLGQCRHGRGWPSQLYWTMPPRSWQAIPTFWTMPPRSWRAIPTFQTMSPRSWRAIPTFWTMPPRSWRAIPTFWTMPPRSWRAIPTFRTMPPRSWQVIHTFWIVWMKLWGPDSVIAGWVWGVWR